MSAPWCAHNLRSCRLSFKLLYRCFKSDSFTSLFLFLLCFRFYKCSDSLNLPRCCEVQSETFTISGLLNFVFVIFVIFTFYLKRCSGATQFILIKHNENLVHEELHRRHHRACAMTFQTPICTAIHVCRHMCVCRSMCAYKNVEHYSIKVNTIQQSVSKRYDQSS